jgi:integrase
MATKLTPKLVAGIAAPARGNRIEYDTDVKGFGVRVTAGGAKAFVLNYRNGAGRERRLTIGRHPEWSVGAARDEAKALLRRIDRGDDPLGQIQADRLAPTFADLADRYIAEHLPRKRPSSQEEDRALLKLADGLRHAKVADLGHADIAALHRKVTKTRGPYRANRVRALLSKMFSLAIVWRMRADNPVRGVERNHEEGRERYLTPAEIARLMKVLAKYDDKLAANIIMLALLTGARRGELLNATWTQFDLDAGVWTKPSSHTKQKRIHRAPLAPEAWQLLVAMRAEAPDADRLFAGKSVRYAWEKIRLEARLGDVRFHDLRHSFASMLASSGQSLPIIGRLLGHTQAQTSMRYAHLQDDILREAAAGVGKLVGGGS